MGAFKLPQQDEREKRASEISKEAANYQYNHDIGIPLVQQEGPKDLNKPDFDAKIFKVLLGIRSNVRKIYDFYKWDYPKPKRDIPKFLSVLKTGSNPVDYFTPDLGFIAGKTADARPKSINDYKDKIFADQNNIFGSNSPVPLIANVWDSDKTFAHTFLAGPDPTQIKKYPSEQPLPNFDLSNFNLGDISGFEGDNIKTALGDGRIFYVDHSNLTQLFANLPNAPAPNATTRTFNKRISGDWKYIYAPIAAFAVPKGGDHMLPIAILCGPKGEGHQIYTPKDGYSWKMARLCVLAAHNNHHEVISHLGLTHLLIDPIIFATRTKLHPSHPIYQLLHPHFEGTVKINVGARTSLIMPEKGVDRLVGSKIEMNYPMLKNERLAYSFRDNFLPARLKSFGVANNTTLPNYPYRDDGLLIWNAIYRWVSRYIEIWYRNDAEILADYEIQAWAKEIQEIGKIRDFCKSGPGVTGREELKEMLTMTIFTAGPQHAVVNFSQGTDMTYVPANPLSGYSQAPKGLDHSEDDFLNMLPPMDVAVQTWSILNLLAGVNNTRLGDYRGAFLVHPVSEIARRDFVDDLRMIEKKILASNEIRKNIFGLPYLHLLPSRIPASTNI